MPLVMAQLHTNPTITDPIPFIESHVKIESGKWMPSFAMSFTRVKTSYAIAAMLINFACYCFKMLGIGARSIAAQMINFHALGNGSDKELVCHSMRSFYLTAWLAKINAPVASLYIYGCNPIPTACNWINLYLRQESLYQGLLNSRVHIVLEYNILNSAANPG